MAYNPIVKLGDLEIHEDRLAEFVVEAKRNINSNSWEGKEISLPDGSKQLTFQKGNFHYTNTYCGYLRFAGNEKVRWEKPEGQLIWQMNYIGRISGAFSEDERGVKETYKFLKQALSNVAIDIPFRGPNIFFSEDKKWEYRCSTQGLNNIRGFEDCSEEIFTEIPEWTGNGMLYSGEYHGGIIEW